MFDELENDLSDPPLAVTKSHALRRWLADALEQLRARDRVRRSGLTALVEVGFMLAPGGETLRAWRSISF